MSEALPDEGEADPRWVAAMRHAFAPAPPPRAAPTVERTSAAEIALIPRQNKAFEPRGEIARGGMGVVMLAFDPELGREVALKILREDLSASPTAVRRFLEEAQISGQLQHPCIVPVYEVGRLLDTRPYFAMKLVRGHTLATLLETKAKRAEERVELLGVFLSVAQAIAYAHSRGVIHRDLKPANVMVGDFGEVQVFDWGLAKVLGARHELDEDVVRVADDDPLRSLPGTVAGTPAYMAPEQARGDVHALDERCDVFALGGILCHVLTGEPPYRGSKASSIEHAAQARLEPALERLRAAEADPELVALATECLAPDPERRPRTASAVAERLHTYLASVEERAHRAQIEAAEARVKAQGERRSRRLTVALATSVLGAATIVLGGWAWVSSEREQRARAADERLALSLEEARTAIANEAWSEALVTIDAARSIAAGSGPSERNAGEALRWLEQLEQHARHEIEARNFRRETEELLGALDGVREPMGLSREYSPARTHADYAASFARIGLDPATADPAAALEALRARQADGALASALDEWSGVCVRLADGDIKRSERESWLQRAARLSSLASALDPDPQRDRMRAAILRSDVSELVRMGEAEDVESWPSESQLLLGNFLGAFGQSQHAIRALEAGQRAHRDDFTFLYNLGCALSLTMPRRWSEATRYLTAALALRPDSVQVRRRLIDIFSYWDADWCALEPLAAEILERLPGDGEALQILGDVRFWRREFRAAIEFYEQAALDPRNEYFARRSIAAAAKSAGDFAREVRERERCLELRAFDPWTRSELVRARRDAGEPVTDADVRAALAKTELDLGVDGNALENLADTYRAEGDLASALRALVASRCSFDHPSVYEGLSVVTRLRGDLVDALEQARLGMANDATFLPNRLEELRCLALLGREAELALPLEALVAWTPQNDVDRLAYVEFLGFDAPELALRPERAAECARDLVRRFPKAPRILCLQGMCDVQRGAWSEARTALERALALDRDNDPDVRLYLARALSEQGELEGAREQLTAALSLASEQRLRSVPHRARQLDALAQLLR
jgi:hypothetical protein